jgi:hypothetical protein
VNNLSVAKVAGKKIEITGVGQANVTVTQSGNELWEAASVTSELKVSKGVQTISFAEIPEQVFGVGEISIDITVSSGLEVALSSSDTEVASVAAKKIKVLNSGQTSVTANQQGNTNWESANSVTRLLKVKKSDQQLKSNLPDTVFTKKKAIWANIGASSGLPVVLRSSNEFVAKIKSDSIILVEKGETMINASQAGNRNYNSVSGSYRLVITNPLSFVQFGNVKFSLFPNPAHGTFNLVIDGEVGFPLEISLVNTMGEPILNQKIVKNFAVIDIQGVLPGVYFVVIQSENGYKIEKLIVK